MNGWLRWLCSLCRFRLRSLLIAVTIFCALLAWRVNIIHGHYRAVEHFARQPHVRFGCDLPDPMGPDWIWWESSISGYMRWFLANCPSSLVPYIRPEGTKIIRFGKACSDDDLRKLRQMHPQPYCIDFVDPDDALDFSILSYYRGGVSVIAAEITPQHIEGLTRLRRAERLYVSGVKMPDDSMRQLLQDRLPNVEIEWHAAEQEDVDHMRRFVSER